MRFCYADPPYPGQAKSRYGHDPKAAEVDPVALMERLHGEGWDGWAMSSSVPALRVIAPAMPKGARLCAWTKTFARMRPKVWPCYAWEPVIVWGGRGWDRNERTPRDWIACDVDRTTLMGAKPWPFCEWLFDVWRVEPNDTLHDMFSGTGGVAAMFEFYVRACATKEQP